MSDIFEYFLCAVTEIFLAVYIQMQLIPMPHEVYYYEKEPADVG